LDQFLNAGQRNRSWRC